MIKEIKNSLKDLNFSDKEIKIYIALTQLGEAPASQIAKKTDIVRTTAIGILEKLKKDNYLTTNKYKGITYYWIESPKALENIFKHKVDIASSLNNLLSDLYRSESHFPYAKIYDTKSAIRGFIEKTIANMQKNSTIYTIDTPEIGNYRKIYSDNINKTILAQKKKKNIITKTLIPHGLYEKIDSYKLSSQNIQIKEMPKEINFKSSLWLIKNMLVHFSANPPFIVAIKHEMIVSSIKSVYDFLWSISKEKN